MSFDVLPLHDAVLSSIHISWEADRCDLRVQPVGEPPYVLVFEGFSALAFPKMEPWGPSSSINTIREPQPRYFEIELQSGDVLKIEAAHWSYRVEVSE